MVIYNKDDKVVRRLEQIKGDCLDPGWISFWPGEARPPRYLLPLVDFDENGKQTVLAPDAKSNIVFTHVANKWVAEHGIDQ